MASIERTAYPRFRRVVTALELAALSPTSDDVRWAKARARSDEHLLALVVALACFQRLGYFVLGDHGYFPIKWMHCPPFWRRYSGDP